jgi:hypothetical protein
MRAEFPTSVRASRMRFRVRVKYSPSFNGTAGGNFLRAIERVRLPAESGHRSDCSDHELTASKHMRADWRWITFSGETSLAFRVKEYNYLKLG